MRAWLVLYAAAIALGASGCSHDLDALRNGKPLSERKVHDAGAPSTLPEAGITDAGGTSPNEGGAPQAGACEPCAALTDAGTALGLRSCCRGAINEECGLTFGEGAVCLPRMVPGQTNADCPAAKQGANDLNGCCRPDGRCGLSATMLDLGCVARDEILPALGAPRVDAIACVFDCNTDDDCAGTPGGFICTEDPKDTTHMHRICVNDCLRDQDCPKGQVCTLGNDFAMDRIQAYCRAPQGTGAVGDYCSSSRDCVHGICLQFKGMPSFCTALCTNAPDCPTARPECFPSSVPSPSKAQMETFNICGPMGGN